MIEVLRLGCELKAKRSLGCACLAIGVKLGGMSNCYFMICHQFASLARIFSTIYLLSVVSECTAEAQELDLPFVPTQPYNIGAFAVQEDGRIVVGEFYETFAAFTDMRRFLPDGSIDSTFNHYGNALQSRNNGQVARVDSVSCFMDGTVALSGSFDRIDNFYSVNRIVKFDLEGRFVFYPAPLTDAANWVVSPSIAPLPDNNEKFGQHAGASSSMRRQASNSMREAAE
jgi:hypothetical protein